MHSFLIAVLAYGYLVVQGTNPKVAPAVNPFSGPCNSNSQGQNICSGSGSWSVAPNTKGAKGYCQISMWPAGNELWEARFTVNKDDACTLHRSKPNVLSVTIKN